MLEFMQFIAMEVILCATESQSGIILGFYTKEEAMVRAMDRLNHAAMFHADVIPMGTNEECNTRAITSVCVGARCHYVRTHTG